MSASVRARVARLEVGRPSAELLTARAALAELGRGLAAAAELLDGRGESCMTGTKHDRGMPVLTRVAAASAPGGSLLGDLARALTGMAS